MVATSSDDDFQAEIEAFNGYHQFVKKGLACVPTKFGIGFTMKAGRSAIPSPAVEGRLAAD